MIIRLSHKNDISGIISLWSESFGDSEEEIMFFIKNKYIPENTLVAELNGEIASVLFLLDGKMCIKGVDYPSSARILRRVNQGNLCTIFLL